jgi:hypothetical protein
VKESKLHLQAWCKKWTVTWIDEGQLGILTHMDDRKISNTHKRQWKRQEDSDAWMKAARILTARMKKSSLTWIKDRYTHKHWWRKTGIFIGMDIRKKRTATGINDFKKLTLMGTGDTKKEQSQASMTDIRAHSWQWWQKESNTHRHKTPKEGTITGMVDRKKLILAGKDVRKKRKFSGKDEGMLPRRCAILQSSMFLIIFLMSLLMHLSLRVFATRLTSTSSYVE